MSPLVTVLFIVLAVAFAGAVMVYVRDAKRYSGYSDLMRETMALATAVRGEVFRKGADLVVSGEFRGAPVVVTISHAENTPGLVVHLGAPATFSLAIFSRAERIYEKRALVRTPDDRFNMRFEARSNQPTQATLFLQLRGVMDAARQLCRSSQDCLYIGDAAVEYSVLGFPTREGVSAVGQWLEHLSALATALNTMPGANAVKIPPRPRQRRIAGRVAIACGIVAAIMALYIGVHPTHRPVARPTLPEGISAGEAAIIGDIKGWRLARPEDMSPTVVQWLHSERVEPASRIAFDGDGSGEPHYTALLLVHSSGQRRVVIVGNGANLFDIRFREVGGIVRLPRGGVVQLAFDQGKTPDVTNESLLIVRDAAVPNSAFIAFLRNQAIGTAIPTEYQRLRIGD